MNFETFGSQLPDAPSPYSTDFINHFSLIEDGQLATPSVPGYKYDHEGNLISPSENIEYQIELKKKMEQRQVERLAEEAPEVMQAQPKKLNLVPVTVALVAGYLALR